MSKKVLVKTVVNLLVLSIPFTGFLVSFTHHELFVTVALADEISKKFINVKGDIYRMRFGFQYVVF
ncbi:hypothetical protein [Enterococcus sp. DIV1420a]|uniref:hypothetical protein n=1 Tax=Enterococcus sp. DIV1420a TaxID=2774672 RepID=UPI003F204307